MGRLHHYLSRLGQLLGDKRHQASFAMYMLGLLSELRRKCAEPIAAFFSTGEREADRLHQRLLHFLADAPWADAPLRATARGHALDELLRHAPLQALIIDDTSFAKSGRDSVGVQRQYCGSLGKVANCQVVVSLTAATEKSHLPIDMQLYLPQSWLSSPSKRAQARIPEDVRFATKIEIALDLIARALADGVPKGVVLADAAYGDCVAFRAGLRRLKLHYAVGIQLATRVELLRTGETLTVESLLARVGARPFRRHIWREGTKRQMTARFAFFPVRIPSDDEGRDETLHLVIERRDGAKQRDRAHLCRLPLWMPRHRMIYLLKERWRTEAAYRELKQELGLEQYEGRRYPGLQHHLTAALCAYAFIAAERARALANVTPDTPYLVRSPQRLQKHVPHSFPTLRLLLASAIKPWLLEWLASAAENRRVGRGVGDGVGVGEVI